MFRLFLINFGYFIQDEYLSFDEAINAAKQRCFQIAVYQGETLLATVCPIVGTKHYR